MLNKRLVIHALNECIKIKENISSVYNKNINNPLFFSGFNKTHQSRVKYMLEMLKRETEQHKKGYKELLTKIEESTQDVY